MKAFMMCWLMLGLCGCMSKGAMTADVHSEESVVIYAYQNDDSMCYARFVRHFPVDRICAKNDNIVYTETPNIREFGNLGIPMPNTVDALMRATPVNTILQRLSLRSSIPQGKTFRGR